MKFVQFCLSIFFVSTAFSSMQRFENSQKSCELVEQTLVVVKPEAVSDRNVGKLIEEFENSDLSIIALKMKQLAEADAESFYSIHKKKKFYQSLVKYMSSGPIVVMALEGRDAVAKVRKLVGDTNPKAAQKGTLREKYGQSIEKNAVHASDSIKNAKKEILFFFTASDLYSPCSRIVFQGQ